MEFMSTATRFRVRVLKLAIVAACSALPAFAEEPSSDTAPAGGGVEPRAAETKTTEEVVVVATRTSVPLDKVPASVGVLTQDDFTELQAPTVGQALKKLPNVEFGGGARINGQIPTIRGYYGPSVALLVDGARQNDVHSPGMRSPLYVNPYFLRRAEVLRGSASSLYGSGGIGGAMVFTTLSATDLLETDQGFGAGVSVGIATANSADTTNARVYGRIGGVDGLVALGRVGWDRIEQGGGTFLQPNDGQSKSELVKLGSNLENYRVELSHQRYDSSNLQPRNPQADSSLPGAPVTSVARVHQKQTVASLNPAARTDSGSVSATAYQTDLTVIDEAGASAVAAPYSEMRTKTNGASFQWTVSPVTSHRIIAGIDGYRDKESAVSGSAPNPVNPDGTRDVNGVFLQDEISLGDGWILTPGVRRDHFQTTVDGGDGTDASHVSPKVTLSWRPRAGLMVYGNYGEAFRAPTLGEMYANISGTSYFMNFAPNPDLRPELDRTREIGGHYRHEFGVNNALTLRAAYFKSRSKDLISNTNIGSYTRTAPPFGTGFIWQSQNVSNARRSGGEYEVGHEYSLWRTHLAYSRLRVTDADTGNGLYSPPDKVNFRVQWRQPATGVSVLWNSTAVLAQDYDATVLRRRPGYPVHDLFATFESGNHRYRVDMGVTNLFDKRYSDYQSGMAYGNTPQEGKSVKIMCSTEF
jgi:hemoglobin/transferrin/lactoferrin receptor protein